MQQCLDYPSPNRSPQKHIFILPVSGVSFILMWTIPRVDNEGPEEVRYASMYRSYWSGIRVRLVGLVYADVVAARNVEKCDMQNTRACARLRSRDVLIYSRRCVVSASNSTSKTRCNPPPEMLDTGYIIIGHHEPLSFLWKSGLLNKDCTRLRTS